MIIVIRGMGNESEKKKILLFLLITDMILMSALFYLYVNELFMFDKKEERYSNTVEVSDGDALPDRLMTRYDVPETLELNADDFVDNLTVSSGESIIRNSFDSAEIVKESTGETVIAIGGLSLEKGLEYSFTIDIGSLADNEVRLTAVDGEDRCLDEVYITNSGSATYVFSAENPDGLELMICLSDEDTYRINDYSLSCEEKLNHIRIDQLGYRSGMRKIAVFKESEGSYFEVVDADSGAVVFKGPIVGRKFDSSADETVGYGDFSSVTAEGRYYLRSQYGSFSYEFEISDSVYEELTVDAFRMITTQRCGDELPVSLFGDFAHEPCHQSTIIALDLGFEFEAAGGWHDAGDYGRYTSTIDKTAIELMMAYTMNPDLYGDDTSIPESGNGTPDILDEIRVATDYLMKIQLADGSVLEKIITRSYAGWVEPEDDNGQLYAFPPTTMTSAFSAGILMYAYDLYRDFDPEYAELCRQAAERAYDYVDSRTMVGIRVIAYFSNNGQYRDQEDLTERYFMNLIFGTVLNDDSYIRKAEMIAENDEIELVGTDYCNPSAYASYLFVSRYDGDLNDFRDLTTMRIVDAANTISAHALENGYLNSNADYVWGTNYHAANDGAVLGFAYNITGYDVYLENACNQLHYILGNNTLSRSYVTGYGTVSPVNIHHRMSEVENTVITGAMVGGANSYRERDEGLATDHEIAPARNYVDSQASYSTNEVAIYYNSSLELLLSLAD